MGTNPLDQIKAQQIAEAKDGGAAHPYESAVSAKPKQKSAPSTLSVAGLFNPLDKIKQAQQHEAKQLGKDSPYSGFDPASGPDRSASVRADKLEHYQAAISADLAQLSAIKDIAEKAKAKAEMLKTYWSFVKSYVDSGDKYPNDIAVRICIWLFDIFDIERALDLAFYLIGQGCQVMPPKFDRDLPTFVCDAMYDWSVALLKLEQSASPYLDTLVAHIDNDGWQLATPVQSKMYAILAKHKNREGDFLNCVALCEKAEAVNPEGAGVKTLKAQAQAKIKQEQPE
jgi:hypothetical protein